MHGMWHDMFYPDIPLLAKILRPIIVYLFLIVGMRLAGKRQLAQLNPFDLIVLLTLSNTVQNAIIGNDNSVTGGLGRSGNAAGRELHRRAVFVRSSGFGADYRGKADRADV